MSTNSHVIALAEGADVKRTEENAARSLVRAFGLLERVMQPYFARFGITGSQWGILRTLHRAEREGRSSLRLTDLSDRLLVRPPSMTGAVNRLERAGLVSRDASASDLRAKEVRLTPRGRRRLREVLAVHAQQIDCVLSGLSRAEQATLRRLLDRLGEHLQGMFAEGGADDAPRWPEAELDP
jgi:DNA-binding MarR family transcriptional regulator